MQGNPDPSSDPENLSLLLNRREALRRGLILSLGVATVVAVPGCAGGGNGGGNSDEDDED